MFLGSRFGVPLVLIGGLAGSLPCVLAQTLDAEVQFIRERPSSIFCSCNNIQGRELVFDLVLRNASASPETVFVFVWASNDDLNPPERGLWPQNAAGTALTPAGDLHVTKPDSGMEVELAPGEKRFLNELSILQPIGWFEGELARFKLLRVQLWNRNQGVVLDREFQVLLSRMQP